MEVNEVTQGIIGAAIEVHRHTGPGLLESVYKACMVRELSLRNLAFNCEVPLNVEYKGIKLDYAYRMDFLVEDSVIIELKAVETLLRLHEAQLLTYLKLTGYKTGLLINFNVPILKNGIKRLTIFK